MSTLIEDAVRVLRDLPDDIQAAVAQAILESAAGDDAEFMEV